MTPEIRAEIERIRLIHPEAAEWLDEHEDYISEGQYQLIWFFPWDIRPQGAEDEYWSKINNELDKLKKGEPYKVLNRRKKGVKMAEEKKIETGTEWKFMFPPTVIHNPFFGIDYGFKQQPKEKKMNKEIIKMYPNDTAAADLVDRHFPDMSIKDRISLEGKGDRLLEAAKELEEAAKEVK